MICHFWEFGVGKGANIFAQPVILMQSQNIRGYIYGFGVLREMKPLETHSYHLKETSRYKVTALHIMLF